MNNKTITPNTAPFLFDNHEVRTAIGPDGEPWFCAKDVFDALEIEWKGKSGSLAGVPDKWQGVCYLQTPGGSQEAIFLSEAAVYQTAFRSRKAESIRFTEWVCEDVLPSLRRQGFYGQIKHKDRLAYSRHILALTQRLGREHDAFVRNVLMGELREMCRITGQRMPDPSSLGRFTGLC